ncbi:BRIX domain [Plasmodium ovale wallikeri]|uniref:BRIX domain n=1 Tax=Plasmodium ovale wallikeri TaxID=864142 RepID=A0A1A8YIU2_PLAOA|nr:BRIX domain [Plasmodium ovale wallikeri]
MGKGMENKIHLGDDYVDNTKKQRTVNKDVVYIPSLDEINEDKKRKKHEDGWDSVDMKRWALNGEEGAKEVIPGVEKSKVSKDGGKLIVGQGNVQTGVEEKMADGKSDDDEMESGKSDDDEMESGRSDDDEMESGRSDDDEMESGRSDDDEMESGRSDDDEMESGRSDDDEMESGRSDDDEMESGRSDDDEMESGRSDDDEMESGKSDDDEMESGKSDDDEMESGKSDDDEMESGKSDGDEMESGKSDGGEGEDPYLLREAKYIEKNERWKNRQRVLIVKSPLKKKKCESFVDNLKLLLPHHKMESKWKKKDRKSNLYDISCYRNCNNVIFIDVRRERYCMWICKNVTGPSLYFEIRDYIPLHSLMFSGNCLLYSRPLLLFSKSFDKKIHLQLIKEMFIQVFGTSRYHPLSKPFYDHCYYFYHINNFVIFRHYQILPETLADSNNVEKQKLVEIGPRFTLHIIKIFEDFFKGRVIYENMTYGNHLKNRKENMKNNVTKKKNNLVKRKLYRKKLRLITNKIKTDIDL